MNMKYRVLLLTLLVLGHFGCSDFLEESSMDEVRPSTVDDLMQVMVGEGYPFSNTLDAFQDFLTDDVQCFGAQNESTLEPLVENLRYIFTWSDEMFDDMTGENVNAWRAYYGKIMGCNTVIDCMSEVTGSQAAKDNLRGQALTMRSWYYFMLVNLYGLPYNYGNPEENPGVPLKLTMDIAGEYYTRNSVAEVYAQIEADLLEGIALLEANPLPTSLYKLDALAAKAMLSRVYLFMENWDEALKYADQVLAVKSDLLSLASANADAFTWQSESSFGVYNESVSNEIIWMYSDMDEAGALYPAGGFLYRSAFGVSNDLMGMYEFVNDPDGENYKDLRPFIFYSSAACFLPPGIPTIYQEFGHKGGKQFRESPSKGIRTAELYLNRAESYIRKYMESGDDSYRRLALNDLNEIREHRYDTRNAAYVPVDIQNADELYKFYQDERRRELSFEDHRWFDLRRYGMPSITHNYFVESTNTQEVSLTEGDLRYVLPIPRVVLNRNPSLVQNER